MKSHQDNDSVWGSWSHDSDRDQERNRSWNQRNSYNRQDDDRYSGQNTHMGGGYTGYAGNINYGNTNDYSDWNDRRRGISSSDYSYRQNQDWNRGMSSQHPDDRNSMYNRPNYDNNNQRYVASRNTYSNWSGSRQDNLNRDNSDWQNSSNREWRNSNYDPYRGGDRDIGSRYYGSTRNRSGYSDWSNQDRSHFERNDRHTDRWNNDNDRGFIDRAGDEVRSWFGDEEAERRRRIDDQQERYRRNTSDRDWM